MTKEPLKIIGINPGTRYLGIAAFEGPEHMDWRIKILKGKWSKEKMKRAVRIISDFVKRYKPGVLAIKRLHPSRSSRNLKKLVEKIKELAKSRPLRVCQYSIGDLESFFNPEEKMNKKRLAEVIVSEYPFSLNELSKEKKIKTVITPGCLKPLLWEQSAFIN